MTNQEPYVFDIDIRALQQSSNRPFHLEQRMQFRKMQARLTAKAAELNRNAFLEERRIKLARRYRTRRQMHDQYCQRTQIQEKMKRSQLSRLLESAEAKRHLLISNQAKNCALAVKKAKEVARLHHLRIEKEREHQRVELERRINHSSQRRNQILRSVGRKFSPNSDIISLTPLEATLIVQNWWRKLKFIPLINCFKRYDLTLEVAGKLDFPVLAARLKSKPLLKAASFLLNRIRCISPLYSQPGKYKNSVKIFMTAYLISAHPSEILGKTDEKGLPHQLWGSAKKMLSTFEACISDLKATNFYSSLHQFLALWDEYFYNFEAWKSMDIRDLVESMTQHFIELDLVYKKFRGEEGNELEWRQEILRQREEIKEQVRNIAGEKAVVELMNKHRLSKQASLEPISSPTSIFIESKLPNTPSTPTTEHASASTSSLLLEHKLNEAFLTWDFPLEANAIQGGKFSVRELAHEIIINPDFKLSSNINTTSQAVRKIATQAFFDDFKERMESGKADTMLLELLVDVRLRISKLLPTSSHFHTKFLSEFDMDLLQQQIELKTFDPNEWITYISNTMKSMCSPVRDELVASILTASDPFKAFRSIFEVLDLMLIDHLNHQISTVRPALIAQAVEYETFKFNTLLDSGEVQLNHTTSWLTTAVQAARNHIETRNPESISHAWPTFETLLSDAFLSLVCSNTPINSENCPETLKLDVKRLFDIQDELQRITVTAALIMICKNIARERFVSNSQTQIELKNGLFAILSDGSTTLNDISSFLIGRLSYETHELPADQQEFLTNMIRKTISYRDSLYLVLSRRLHRILRQLLISGEENPIINSSTLASLGLGVVAKEVASVGSRLAYLVHYNRQVYATHYFSILKRAIAAYPE